MNQTQHKLKKQHGLSLVELLVATAIGLLLILGVTSVFSGNKQSTIITNAMVDLQENARFALSTISRDVRSAGFQGCSSFKDGVAQIKASNAPSNDLSVTSVYASRIGNNGNWSPAPIPTYTAPTDNTAPIPGTDVLVVQYGSSNSLELQSDMTTESSGVKVVSQAGISVAKDDLVIIGDCAVADLFKISNRIEHPGGVEELLHEAVVNQNNGNLSKAYEQANTLVMPFVSHVYYIGGTGLTNSLGEPIRSLYRHTYPFDSAPAEIVQGAENLKLRFGIRDAAGNLSFVTADNATFDPRDIEIVQVGMLMSSWDNISELDDQKTYSLAGDDVPPGTGKNGSSHASDQRLRLAFNTSITIRNRR